MYRRHERMSGKSGDEIVTFYPDGRIVSTSGFHVYVSYPNRPSSNPSLTLEETNNISGGNTAPATAENNTVPNKPSLNFGSNTISDTPPVSFAAENRVLPAQVCDTSRLETPSENSAELPVAGATNTPELDV